MKSLVETYSFNSATKQITLTGIKSINLENLLLITNVTDNIIIYNFADPDLGATVSGNVITLDYNTATMSNTDRLQIFVETDDYYETMSTLMDAMLRTVSFAKDPADRMRVIMDNNPMLYLYMRNSSSSLNGNYEPWYSVGSWNTVDAREQLMAISNQNLTINMQRWT
ncbi:MAG TPA: hypothetical protein VK190_03055 [Pseudoneobacillus sp.]|jgi:hypothetical protein|nr:hypothetical protein [Pseudoneobacillus sp.]